MPKVYSRNQSPMTAQALFVVALREESAQGVNLTLSPPKRFTERVIHNPLREEPSCSTRSGPS